MKDKIVLNKGIDDNTEIYRFISLAQFMTMLETSSTYLTRVSRWEDPWEGIPFKLEHIVDNRQVDVFKTMFEGYFGQCWSLSRESDAMWRIYSKDAQGLCFKTRLHKIAAYERLKTLYIGKVIYYNEFNEKILENKIFQQWLLFKRESFRHENEIRLVVDQNDIKNFNGSSEDYISINIDVMDFVEEVIIDPRASDWYVNTIKLYCSAHGISNVNKSDLYGENFPDCKIKWGAQG